MRGSFAPFGRSHEKSCSILWQTRELSKPSFVRGPCPRTSQIRQQQPRQVLALAMPEQYGMVRAGAKMCNQAKIAARIGSGEAHGEHEIVMSRPPGASARIATVLSST